MGARSCALAVGLVDISDMRMRNGDYGYGLVTKSLHWLTVLTIGGQFAVGYAMAPGGDAREAVCDPAGEDRRGAEISDAEEERLDRLEGQCEAEQDRLDAEADDSVATAWADLGSGDLFSGGLSLPEAHVLLGLVIVALGVLRLAWRNTTPLPPWEPRLTPANRRFVHGTEVALLALQFLVPATGILLVTGSDDLLAVHIAAHVAFFLALAAHLGMVIGKGLVPRMLPWRASADAGR
jgi:cytochrome b561